MYATSEDFCRIFTEDMARFYRLALMLTANHQEAERCFIAAFDDCFQMNSVFKGFAKSWCRRAIIKNAIQKIRPDFIRADRDEGDTAVYIGNKLAAVIQLETFERHVFVISILEGFSDHECSILLDSTRTQVIRARVCALHHLELVRPVELSSEHRAMLSIENAGP